MSRHLALLALVVPALALAQEPPACLSPDPTQWPAPSKPYFLVLADTSAAMGFGVVDSSNNPINTSCAMGSTRSAHERCALRQAFEAYAGQVSFGLATEPISQQSCSTSACTCLSSDGYCFLACSYYCAASEINTRGTCAGCGPKPGAASTASGAELRVPIRQDAFWMVPPPPDNVSQLLAWTDNSCASNTELFANGNRPLNGMLRDAKRYFAGTYVSPLGGPTLGSPLASQDLSGAGVNGGTACRDVNVILLTAGDETCDTQADAVAAAQDLYQNGVTIGGKTFKVRVHVVNFAGGNQANTDQLASAGGTGSSYFVTNETQLLQALSAIVTGSLPSETCDNRDNDCNGCSDEGFSHFADLGQTCCAWSTAAQRATCLNAYFSTITPQNPRGSLALLPCTTLTQQAQPATWLCPDPGEICDGVDNNANGAVDEGVQKCGNPLHCPTAEICNGADDNCNGIIDDGVCGTCQPVTEICDGCDNDCDGMADDGVNVQVACGAASPASCAGVQTCKPPQAVPIGGCVANGGYTACNNSPATEVCDGLDNDCDGVTDDGVASTPCVPSGTPTTLVYGGTSRCLRGVQSCGASLCSGFVGPIAETCNGVDDDCDGQVDDATADDQGHTAGQACCPSGSRCGVGRCSQGAWSCMGGVFACTGGAGAITETCNGVDDDCNGFIDDVFGEGAECDANGQPGRRQCNVATQADECVAAPLCGGTGGGTGGGMAGGGGGSAGGGGGATGGGAGGGAAGGGGGSTGGGMGGGAAGGGMGGGAAGGGMGGGTAGGGMGGGATGGGTGGGATGGGTAGGTATGGGTAGGSATGGGAEGGGAGGSAGGTAGGGSAGGGAEAPKGCGCSGDSSLGSLALALALLWRRRRLTTIALALAAGVALFATGCTSKSESQVAAQTQALACVDAGCGDTQVDPDNCGACGSRCVLPNAVAGCSAGHCTVASCTPGFADLDGQPDGGCEASCQGDGGLERCDGIDNDCNGLTDEGFDRQADPRHCGAACTDCAAADPLGAFSCDQGTCQRAGCQVGAALVDGGCVACVPTGAELCNGLDDDCDGVIDDGVIAPAPTAVCGVSPNAATPECSSAQIGVACVNGAWRCTFPSGVCNPTCAGAVEVCDGLDNDCDGLLNENVPSFGLPCASDDGLPPPGHGACRTTGTYVCNGANAAVCSAVKADCNTLPGGCTELCDGLDNDCDGLVDETFNNKGTNTTNFVKPVVTKIAASQWIYSYEASRPSATAVSFGRGNGYFTSAPIGSTMDKTPACSVPNRLPWARVTPLEVEQICQAMGGTVCSTSQWTGACSTPSACRWGYAPRGTACTSGSTSTKFCNLGPSFDSTPSVAGDQDNVLPTASAALLSCYADWSGLQGNTATTNKLFDLTGNLREITRTATNDYRLMGGSYLSSSESGAQCANVANATTQNFSAADLGFRCCFTADPTQ